MGAALPYTRVHRPLSHPSLLHTLFSSYVCVCTGSTHPHALPSSSTRTWTQTWGHPARCAAGPSRGPAQGGPGPALGGPVRGDPPGLP